MVLVAFVIMHVRMQLSGFSMWQVYHRNKFASPLPLPDQPPQAE